LTGWLSLALLILLAPELKGQSSAIPPTSRSDQIDRERLNKANQIGPDQVGTSEKTRPLRHFIHLVPISFEVGGLGPGAGPAVNAEFREPTYNDRLLLKVWGHLAVQNFYSVGTGAELRNFSNHNVTVALDGSYSNALQLEYYGIGPNCSIHERTDFRREETLLNFGVRLRLHRHVDGACSLGQLLLHIGPGTNDELATTQSVFGPNEAPGIDTPSNDYLIAGCSAQLDLRDFPEDPHKGTYAQTTFDQYYSETDSGLSFYRLSLAGEQYIPFFNRKRVIALRAQTELSFHNEDQFVPFYVQPTLGSDTELHGFRRYRFYDENSISESAEYRWEISTGFDMALFVVHGRFFHK
jgi:hypothetical protein